MSLPFSKECFGKIPFHFQVQFSRNIKGKYLFVVPFQVLLDYTYVGKFKILEVCFPSLNWLQVSVIGNFLSGN